MDKETNVLSEEERLSAKIEEILAKINSDPNPEELEALKKIIKKKVPFTRRSYFAAMLLKMVTSQVDRRERAPRESLCVCRSNFSGFASALFSFSGFASLA